MNAAEFEPVEMVDTGVSGDVQAGDGVYTATVLLAPTLSFCFTSEPAMTMP